MQSFSLIVAFCSIFSYAFSEMHHHPIKYDAVNKNTYLWEIQGINPFDELLISWNGFRPAKGYYAIYVSVDTGLWSPWLLYAEWGKEFQKSFSSEREEIPVRVYQDAVEVLAGNKANGFRVRVVAEKGASLSELHAIHVCSSNLDGLSYEDVFYARPSTLLDVEGLSQMALADNRKERLCSPTATTAVLRFLKNDRELDPIQFAERCWDSGFDIFGNWVFTVAEAYSQLHDSEYSCWVERHENFSGILDSLKNGFPCVISVRGPLPGSAQPYASGHLIAVIGFDADSQEVICMDPAFAKDDETCVRYALHDLLKSWERRKNVAYMFSKAL